MAAAAAEKIENSNVGSFAAAAVDTDTLEVVVDKVVVVEEDKVGNIMVYMAVAVVDVSVSYFIYIIFQLTSNHFLYKL
jgi:hypothetical protein